MLGFALPLLALEVSGQGSEFALILGVAFFPNILFPIFLGAINDRTRRAFGFRLYAILMTGARVLLSISLFGGTLSVTGPALVMILMGALGDALGKLQATLIRLVVSEDQLSEATSLGCAINAVITTLGPDVAGSGLSWFGYGGLCLAVTCVMILATGATFTINPTETLPKQPFWPSLRDGWRVFLANRELVMMTVVIGLTNAAEGAFGVGLILAAGGAGSVIGASAAPRIR